LVPMRILAPRQGNCRMGKAGWRLVVDHQPVPEASGQDICDVWPSMRHVPGTFRLYGTYGCKPASQETAQDRGLRWKPSTAVRK
jgi:hypothetical protein